MTSHILLAWFLSTFAVSSAYRFLLIHLEQMGVKEICIPFLCILAAEFGPRHDMRFLWRNASVRVGPCYVQLAKPLTKGRTGYQIAINYLSKSFIDLDLHICTTTLVPNIP